MTEDLNNFFKLISEDKNKRKEEYDSIVGDLGLDSLFNEFAVLKKKEKEKQTKKKKVKEEEEKTVKSFEKWLYSDSEKEEEEVINEVIEQSLDEVLEVIKENKEELEKTEEIEEKTFVDESLKVLTEIANNQPENIKEPNLHKKFATLEDLDKHYRVFLYRIQEQLSSLGGGGEVRLEFLDDVDRNTAKVDGNILKYQSSTDKWIGAASGIEVFNDGSSVGTGITSINFSTNVTVTASGGISTVTASGGGSSVAIIDEVETFAVPGGSFISGAWQDRDLNTVTSDDDDIIDLNTGTGEVTLKAAGTYKIDFRAPGLRCDSHVTRILDTSITLVRGRGSTAYSQDTSYYAQTDSVGSTIYTTTDANQKFKLQHRCTTTQSSADGMGIPHNVSAIGNNYYSQVIVTKLS